MNNLESAVINASKDGDVASIEKVRFYNVIGEEITDNEIADSFVGVYNDETDYVLVEHVALKLGIDESKVSIKY